MDSKRFMLLQALKGDFIIMSEEGIRPNFSDMPYCVIMARQILVALSISLDAPVVTSPKMISSAARKRPLPRSKISAGRRRKNRAAKIVLRIVIALVCFALVGVGGVLAARQFVLTQGMQVRQDNETTVVVVPTTLMDGIDPRDRVLRIAPTNPKNEDLVLAVEVLCVCCRMATVEKLIGA